MTHHLLRLRCGAAVRRQVLNCEPDPLVVAGSCDEVRDWFGNGTLAVSVLGMSSVHGNTFALVATPSGDFVWLPNAALVSTESPKVLELDQVAPAIGTRADVQWQVAALPEEAEWVQVDTKGDLVYFQRWDATREVGSGAIHCAPACDVLAKTPIESARHDWLVPEGASNAQTLELLPDDASVAMELLLQFMHEPFGDSWALLLQLASDSLRFFGGAPTERDEPPAELTYETAGRPTAGAASGQAGSTAQSVVGQAGSTVQPVAGEAGGTAQSVAGQAGSTAQSVAKEAGSTATFAPRDAGSTSTSAYWRDRAGESETPSVQKVSPAAPGAFVVHSEHPAVEPPALDLPVRSRVESSVSPIAAATRLHQAASKTPPNGPMRRMETGLLAKKSQPAFGEPIGEPPLPESPLSYNGHRQKEWAVPNHVSPVARANKKGATALSHSEHDIVDGAPAPARDGRVASRAREPLPHQKNLCPASSGNPVAVNSGTQRSVHQPQGNESPERPTLVEPRGHDATRFRATEQKYAAAREARLRTTSWNPVSMRTTPEVEVSPSLLPLVDDVGQRHSASDPSASSQQLNLADVEQHTVTLRSQNARHEKVPAEHQRVVPRAEVVMPRRAAAREEETGTLREPEGASSRRRGAREPMRRDDSPDKVEPRRDAWPPAEPIGPNRADYSTDSKTGIGGLIPRHLPEIRRSSADIPVDRCQSRRGTSEQNACETTDSGVPHVDVGFGRSWLVPVQPRALRAEQILSPGHLPPHGVLEPVISERPPSPSHATNALAPEIEVPHALRVASQGYHESIPLPNLGLRLTSRAAFSATRRTTIWPWPAFTVARLTEIGEIVVEIGRPQAARVPTAPAPPGSLIAAIPQGRVGGRR